MRKVISGTLMSINGVIGSPHEWASEYFDGAAVSSALDQLHRSHAMLMGRRTYEIFSQLWPNGSGPYPEAINAMPKYVFSSTLDQAEWQNTTVAADALETVARLKQEGDDDLIMYGHGQVGRALLDGGLLDELRVWVHPRFVGSGTLMFQEGQSTKLRHVETQTLDTGVVELVYAPQAG